MTAQPLVENREAWLEARKRYIGGTDIAAIVGKHRYKTALGVYAEKVLGVVDAEQSLMAMMGLALEPVVRIVAERDLKRPVYHSAFAVHPKYPFLAVNPDGEFNEKEGVELKTHGFATRDEWGEEMTDEVPDEYHVQTTWQCGIKGWDRCYVVAFDRDKANARYYCVEANPDYFQSLVSIGDRFWHNHIVAKVEPKVAAAEDLEVVKAIYKTQESEIIIATDEHDEITAQYMRISAAISEATKERDLAKAQLIQAIGGAMGLRTSHGPVTYKPRTDGVRVFKAPTIKAA